MTGARNLSRPKVVECPSRHACLARHRGQLPTKKQVLHGSDIDRNELTGSSFPFLACICPFGAGCEGICAHVCNLRTNAQKCKHLAYSLSTEVTAHRSQGNKSNDRRNRSPPPPSGSRLPRCCCSHPQQMAGDWSGAAIRPRWSRSGLPSTRPRPMAGAAHDAGDLCPAGRSCLTL